MNTDDRVARLPKWARNRIETLEAELIDVRRGNRQAVEGETDVFIDNILDEEPLPPRSQIRFVVGRYRYFTVKLRDGELHVSTTGKLSISPGASNIVYLQAEGC